MDRKDVEKIHESIKLLALPEKPKRGLTSFFCFREEQIENLKSKHPEKSFIELSSVLSEKWKNLSEGEKRRYEEISQKSYAEQDVKIEAYNQKYKAKLV